MGDGENCFWGEVVDDIMLNWPKLLWKRLSIIRHQSIRSLLEPPQNRSMLRVSGQVGEFVGVVLQIMKKLINGVLIQIAGILEAFSANALP